MAYDAANRMVTLVEPVSDTETITTHFGYDANGQQTRLVDGRDNSFYTVYTPAGRPSTHVEPATDATPDETDRSWRTLYDAAGDPVRQIVPGGIVRNRTYDALGRLVHETATGAEAATEDREFDYDHAGRLVSWTAPDGTVTEYAWDASGNRITEGTTEFGYDERNRLVSSSDGDSWTYTPRGTLTSATADGMTTTPVFDGFDRMVVSGDGTLGYGYDSLGRLVSRTSTWQDNPVVAARTDVFLYAGMDSNPVAVVDPTGIPQSSYGRDPSGELLSIGEKGQTPGLAYSNVHTDLVATYSPSGQVASSTDYTPFGEVAAGSGTLPSLGYQGEWTDPDTGDVNMHARWYQPGTGRFASRDPLTPPPVPSAQANRYTYANPMVNTDPSGHVAIAIPIAAGAGLGSALITIGLVIGTAALAGYVGYRIYQGVSQWVGASARSHVRTVSRPTTTCRRRCGGSGQAGGGTTVSTSSYGGTTYVRPGYFYRPSTGYYRPGINNGNGAGSGGSAPVVRVDPRKEILDKLLRTPAPRPPIVNSVTQEDIDSQRLEEEAEKADQQHVKIDLQDLYEEYEQKIAEPGTKPANSREPISGDYGDDDCIPYVNYGYLDAQRRPHGIV